MTLSSRLPQYGQRIHIPSSIAVFADDTYDIPLYVLAQYFFRKNLIFFLFPFGCRKMNIPAPDSRYTAPGSGQIDFRSRIYF
jgi:hypothetical protein